MSFARADNQTIAHCLDAMRALVIAHGGFVHADAYVEERDGAMRTMCRSPACIGKPIFRIPDALLVPVKDLVWNDDESALRLADFANSSLTPVRAEMLDLILVIYNAANKLPWARNLPGYVAGRDPEIAALIKELRPDFSFDRCSLAECFIDTRIYASSSVHEGIPDGRCFMPLIDFANNHFAGSRYEQDGGHLQLTANYPDGTDECFARYGSFRDPLGLALNYGYLDRTFPFAQSLPLELDLPVFGQLIIEGVRDPTKHSADLPKVRFSEAGVIMSHLSGDANQPGNVKPILRLALMASAKRRGIPDAEVKRTLADLPSMLLEVNRAKLTRASNLLATKRDLPVAALLQDAIGLQLGNLEQVLAS